MRGGSQSSGTGGRGMQQPRMRTIDQAAAWIQETDPETAFTKTALRRLVTTGQLPGVVRIGQKYLVNLDVLEAYLSGRLYNA